MAREFPQWLYSATIDTKSAGPFIVRTLSPKVIFRVYAKRDGTLEELNLVDRDLASDEALPRLYREAMEFYEFRVYPTLGYPSSRLVRQLLDLQFLENTIQHFTVEEAKAVISKVFTTPVKAINTNHSSYGYKHLLEYISAWMNKSTGYKYCSNDTCKQAFLELGYASKQMGPNLCFNVSERDYSQIWQLVKNSA